jgi:hypothetical protein
VFCEHRRSKALKFNGKNMQRHKKVLASAAFFGHKRDCQCHVKPVFPPGPLPVPAGLVETIQPPGKRLAAPGGFVWWLRDGAGVDAERAIEVRGGNAQSFAHANYAGNRAAPDILGCCLSAHAHAQRGLFDIEQALILHIHLVGSGVGVKEDSGDS